MKIFRVFAVGLLVSAVLMTAFSQTFFAHWAQAMSFQVWVMALNSLSPSSVTAMGLEAVPVVVFSLLTTGAGFLISAVGYSPIDDLFFSNTRVLTSRPLTTAKR